MINKPEGSASAKLNSTANDPTQETHLEVLAKGDELGHALLLFGLDDCLLLLGEALLLVGDEFAEGANEVVFAGLCGGSV
jgi:hypothetical protein